jgi:membrane protease YdiL (CAAX protease family)
MEIPEFKPARAGALALAILASLAASAVFYVRPGILSILMTWCITIGLAMAGLGRQRPGDVGLRAAGILPGMAYGALYWLSLQAAVIVMAPWFGKRAGLDPQLAGGAWLAFAGPLLDQLIFFASAEEIVHRGFVMPQIYLRLRARLAPRTALTAAALFGSAFFALLHIPQRLLGGVSARELPVDLLLLVMAGVFFCAIYLLTGNLLCAVLVHALSNFPTLPYDAALPWQPWLAIKYALALLAAGLYALWFRRLSRAAGPATR